MENVRILQGVKLMKIVLSLWFAKVKNVPIVQRIMTARTLKYVKN
jgi:hypothetical protein